MSRTHEVAWAAGFFDGEGFVTIQRRKIKRVLHNGSIKFYESHYLRIGINHVAPEPLVEMQRLFGGNLRYTDKTIGNRKPRHSWGLSCQKAKDVLIQLMPYMRNKQKAAEIGIELQNTMNPSVNKTKGTPQTVTDYRDLLKQKLQTLNSLD